MNNKEQAIQWGIQQLSTSPTPRLDSQWLFEAAQDRADFEAMIHRRMKGEPVAFILGQQDFWSLTLAVSPLTLIPRPETELLVELILTKMPDSALSVLDLGTGSGAIGLALAKERPHWSITATDYCEEIIKLARANQVNNHINNIRFSVGSWFEAVNTSFDIIVSNPPYIAEHDPHLRALWEPKSALVGGPCGLEDLRSIIYAAPDYLTPGGLLMLEHGYDQKSAVQDFFSANGFSQIETFQDLAGIDRVTMGFLT